MGGLIFGVGFVVGGWCPGTAAVGAASGKLDALVFLGGTVLGSIGFNETYGLWATVAEWGAFDEPLFAFGLSKTVFALLFTLVAIAAFHFAEWVERPAGGGQYLGTPFLKAFSLALVVFAVALFILPGQPPTVGGQPAVRATARGDRADAAGRHRRRGGPHRPGGSGGPAAAGRAGLDGGRRAVARRVRRVSHPREPPRSPWPTCPPRWRRTRTRARSCCTRTA